MTIVAAADGSALGNPGPAGWAWYVDDDRWAAGGWPKAMNNQGELTAVLQLLRATKDTGEPLHILCDSQYAIKACTEWLSIGSRKPAMAATRVELPATDSATFLAPMKPFSVSTPSTRPFSIRKPVAAQFWIMSTPRESAMRA